MVFVSSKHHAGRWWPKLVAKNHLGAWSTHKKQDGTNSKSSHLSAPAFVIVLPCALFLLTFPITSVANMTRRRRYRSQPSVLVGLTCAKA